MKRPVTKGVLERKNIKLFGVRHNEDDLRQNANLTSI
jgi:hypothetical protein